MEKIDFEKKNQIFSENRTLDFYKKKSRVGNFQLKIGHFSLEIFRLKKISSKNFDFRKKITHFFSEIKFLHEEKIFFDEIFFKPHLLFFSFPTHPVRAPTHQKYIFGER